MSEPGSLTSIAFNTGVIAERQRIIKLLQDKNWKCPVPGVCEGKAPDCLCWTIDIVAGVRQ